MGYVPSQAARALRTGKSGVLGLVLPDIASPLFPQIAQAIEQAASRAGYGILIADSRGDVTLQTEAINRLIERGVDGLIIVPRRGTRIASVEIPFAVIDSPSTPGNTVSADHWQGGGLVGAHLSALGHRNITLIGNNPASNVQNDRIGGIRASLSGKAEVEVLWIERHEAEHGAGSLLGLAKKVRTGTTAFAAVSDLHALRAMTELHRANIRVPEEATVIGFDDLFWGSVITPALTSVRMDMPRIADIAIASIAEKIDGKRDHPIDDNARVPMSLVIRQSCGPAPKTASR
jgi:LacI family transcriptional regulator